MPQYHRGHQLYTLRELEGSMQKFYPEVLNLQLSVDHSTQIQWFEQRLIVP